MFTYYKNNMVNINLYYVMIVENEGNFLNISIFLRIFFIEIDVDKNTKNDFTK